MQFCKCKIIKFIWRKLRVIADVTALQHKSPLLCGRGPDTFISDTNKCLQHSVSRIIVRSVIAFLDIQNKQRHAIRSLKAEPELRHGIKVSFDNLAGLFSNSFGILQPHSCSVIRYAENKTTSIAVGKCANTFAPAFGAFFLKSLLLVIFSCLAY